jgi:ABC-type amino acid transport substrate-binding protein
MKMNRNRALIEIIKGESINVYVAATRNEWEEKTIPIRIPVLKGLLGYRLLLVHKKNLKKFKKIKNIGELKELRAGLGTQWTTTMVLKNAGFTVEMGNDYEGLFKMLNSNRFDYFPRGVNEIFLEFEARKSFFPNIQIEPTMALYFPTPSYFFVSPKYPELADRMKRGMEIIVQNGIMDTIFEESYNDAISQADLNNRNIYKFENPFLSPETPFDRPELWYTPNHSR